MTAIPVIWLVHSPIYTIHPPSDQKNIEGSKTNPMVYIPFQIPLDIGFLHLQKKFLSVGTAIQICTWPEDRGNLWHRDHYRWLAFLSRPCPCKLLMSFSFSSHCCECIACFSLMKLLQLSKCAPCYSFLLCILILFTLPWFEILLLMECLNLLLSLPLHFPLTFLCSHCCYGRKQACIGAWALEEIRGSSGCCSCGCVCGWWGLLLL